MLPHHHQIVAPHNNPTTTWNHLHHPCPHHHQIHDFPSSRRVSSSNNTALELSANWVSEFSPKVSTFFWVLKFLFHGSTTTTERERETETHPTQREKLCFLFPENYEKYENLLFVSQNRVGLERERKESICVCLCVREGGERNVRWVFDLEIRNY